ncbi:hypothetical protein M409DRAFT_70894 [Zasmidium cellare ATCC 36951]|uniref:Cupin 2 conserved barrel domain-containing protein n=1 Tax=Zasmidium cellare ATCC 36951 TaxID=1080233 RepID=A0A6A6C172_ZASCE|nr:uncharacterized protein M409DRAFT_70894 [Zasmidium cellare ATCC 36951]KAF2159569.1 hypothetical protein M409DRAFT_70894 [Zasmidium cellare ATCC 36951]
MESPPDVGVVFDHGSRITHGDAANVKKPFDAVALTMHELSPSTDYRLPRHIHMSIDTTRLVDERIMILHGVGLVEMAGEVFAVAPGSLVTTVGGVPHTFTACPAGVRLPHGIVSTGTFTMVYEYEEPTSFFPTKSTTVVKNAADYEPWEGSLDEIKFPKLTAGEVSRKGE